MMFSILDAIGNIPIFHALLSSLTEEEKNKVITQSIILAAIILLVFAYGGYTFFNWLGLKLEDLKIAGGILLFILAYDLLAGEEIRIRKTRPEYLAVFPLATPLLAGPGAVTTAIIISQPPYNPIISLIAIIINIVLAWIILMKSGVFMRILGKTGMQLFSRIMGIIIASMAIMLIRTAILKIIEQI